MASFDLPAELKKKFSPGEIMQYKAVFKSFDADGSGAIDLEELDAALKTLHVSAGDTKALLEEADKDNSGDIDFGEFVELLEHAKSGKGAQAGLASNAMAAVVKHVDGMLEKSTKSGGKHSYSEEERAAFALHLNVTLEGDEACAPYLPIDPDSEDLFEKCSNGVLLCALLNKAEDDVVDFRTVNTKLPLKPWHLNENGALVVNAAKAIGCRIVNIGAEDINKGTAHLVLGMLWQIIKVQLTSAISLRDCPELAVLLEGDEELSVLLKMSADKILLRWANYHIKASGSDLKVGNWGKDFADSEAFSIILNQLDKTLPLAPAGGSATERATHVIGNASALGVAPFIQAADIEGAHKNLVMAFAAQIFNHKHGLEVEEEVVRQSVAVCGMGEDDDTEGSREERALRLWINSLNLEDVHVQNVPLESTDGILLLQTMDHIEPGIVKWKYINRPPKNRFKKVENCNACVTAAKAMGLSMVNVGGLDICDGNSKLIIAIFAQLMKKYVLLILSQLQPGKKVGEKEVVAWANAQCAAEGQYKKKVRDCHAKDLASGHFLIDVCHAMRPGIVNWDLVTPGVEMADKLLNAKYVISVARKLGALVFLVPEDVAEVNSKMIMTFLASVWAAKLHIEA